MPAPSEATNASGRACPISNTSSASIAARRTCPFVNANRAARATSPRPRSRSHPRLTTSRLRACNAVMIAALRITKRQARVRNKSHTSHKPKTQYYNLPLPIEISLNYQISRRKRITCIICGKIIVAKNHQYYPRLPHMPVAEKSSA